MADNDTEIKRPLVLVADDDTTVRILARESLEQERFAVEEVENGAEVLSAFECCQPDAILLDVIMPEMDGFSVCAALRKLPGGDFLPVLMMTGMDDMESIYRAYEVGATDFVIKPINWTILGNRVQYMLRASQVNRDLVKSEEKNRALLNAIPDLMFQISRDGTFLDFKAAKNIDLIVSPSEFKNKKLDEVLPKEIAQQTMHHMEEAFQAGEVQVFEYQLLREGNPRYYEARLVVSGEQQVLAIVRDISERKRAEEALQKSQEQLIQAHKMKALGTLVAGVAHEINGPINLVKLNVPVFQKMWRDIQPVLQEQEIVKPGKKYGGMTYDFLKENVSKMFSDIDMASSRVIKTVTNLKNFSKQEEEIAKAPVQITMAIESAVKMAETTLKKSGIDLKLALDTDLPLVEGNLRGIEQIVLNLIINAFQAIEGEAGTITVATRYGAEAKTVFLSVADTGKGIDESISEKIFDPFFTDRQADGGTGLGLSITYNLVKAHGGEISFQSDKGKGTTFTVVLPTEEQKDVPKILVADDNRLIREILVDALTKHRECRVEEAANGVEACIKLGTFLPDLLILNMFMPEMDGLEVCKVIKTEAKLSRLKVVIITSSPDNADVERVAALGFTNVIPKPLDIDQFVRVVDTVLQEPPG